MGEKEGLYFISSNVLIFAGEGLRIWSVRHIGKDSRDTRSAEARFLILSGPYRWVRNPIYIGNILIYVGFAVLSNAFFPWWPMITGACFLIIYHLIARYEESVLTAKFGETFGEYKRQSSRWIPSWPRTDGAKADTRSWNEVVRAERSTWLAIAVCIFLLVLKFFIWKPQA